MPSPFPTRHSCTVEVRHGRSDIDLMTDATPLNKAESLSFVCRQRARQRTGAWLSYGDPNMQGALPPDRARGGGNITLFYSKFISFTLLKIIDGGEPADILLTAGLPLVPPSLGSVVGVGLVSRVPWFPCCDCDHPRA